MARRAESHTHSCHCEQSRESSNSPAPAAAAGRLTGLRRCPALPCRLDPDSGRLPGSSVARPESGPPLRADAIAGCCRALRASATLRDRVEFTPPRGFDGGFDGVQGIPQPPRPYPWASWWRASRAVSPRQAAGMPGPQRQQAWPRKVTVVLMLPGGCCRGTEP